MIGLLGGGGGKGGADTHTKTQNTHPNLPSPPVNQTAEKPYYFFDGYAHLASGLACGLAGLAAGMAIGVVGDAGVRANAQQPKLFVGMILILIFAEALALYGLIGECVGRDGGGGERGERVFTRDQPSSHFFLPPLLLQSASSWPPKRAPPSPGARREECV